MKYEYTTISSGDAEKEMNRLGQKGWRVVSVNMLSKLGAMIIMERPIPDLTAPMDDATHDYVGTIAHPNNAEGVDEWMAAHRAYGYALIRTNIVGCQPDQRIEYIMARPKKRPAEVK